VKVQILNRKFCHNIPSKDLSIFRKYKPSTAFIEYVSDNDMEI
jgi:hypothetical protein